MATDTKSTWEKNLDMAMKAIKKLQEDRRNLPHDMPRSARRKFNLSLDLLEAEVAELKEGNHNAHE